MIFNFLKDLLSLEFFEGMFSLAEHFIDDEA